MSFSSRVKEELEKVMGQARHCQMAELAAIVEFCGRLDTNPGREGVLYLSTDNEFVKRKYFTILKKTYNIGSSDALTLEVCSQILKGLCIIDSAGVLHEADSPAAGVLLKQSCCKRAFLRGAYLCVGSMSDPKGSYHLEFVCNKREQAEQLKELLSDFGLDSRIIMRKNHYVVYMKEGESIVDFLGVCEAHVALMDMENDRIIREVRGAQNRKTNCDIANITKTVNAAVKQLEDIEYLRDHYGFDKLPEGLREIAMARLEYPDASLKELGESLDPPLGKSGVNHRLRKLSDIVDKATCR